MIVHVSSQARPGEREAGCPCAKAACGSAVVDTDLPYATLARCRWHGPDPIAPFMGWHRAEDCPDAPEEDAPLVVRGVIEGARPAGFGELLPKGMASLVAAARDAGWSMVGVPQFAKGEIIERRLGPTPPDGGPRSYIDQAVMIESVVARMSKGHAKLVAVYENGRARAGWRRRTWASNWEDVGMKALRQWAVGQ